MDLNAVFEELRRRIIADAMGRGEPVPLVVSYLNEPTETTNGFVVLAPSSFDSQMEDQRGVGQVNAESRIVVTVTADAVLAARKGDLDARVANLNNTVARVFSFANSPQLPGVAAATYEGAQFNQQETQRLQSAVMTHTLAMSMSLEAPHR